MQRLQSLPLAVFSKCTTTAPMSRPNTTYFVGASTPQAWQIISLSANPKGQRGRSKLAQEAQVVGPELADVVDGVAQHGDALRAHAEGETAELCRVVAAVPQHDRMDHAGAHDLQPARLLAQPAALAGADDAVHVHLNRRLGE